MSKMCTATLAQYFCSAPISVGSFFYGTREFIIEAGPSTAGIEFIGRYIKGSITAATYVNAGICIMFIGATARRFSSFMADDAFFLSIQLVISAHVYSFVTILVFTTEITVVTENRERIAS